MAAYDSPSTVRTGSIIWMTVFLVMIVTLVFGAYYGALSYIAWRYNTTWSFAWPDWSAWLALMRSLPSSMLLEISAVGLNPLLLSFIPLRLALSNFRKSRQTVRGIVDLHGSARWANTTEIKNSGLLPRRSVWARLTGAPLAKRHGVVVGTWQDSPKSDVTMLTDDGKTHTLVFAPTRSGKGVSVVLPTLLRGWTESALVYDPKGEAWAYSAGCRKEVLGQRVFKFDPASTAPDVAKFNPLAEVRVDTQHEVADCQNIAEILVDPDGGGGEKHFSLAAYALLAAIILHVCIVAKRDNKRASFAEVEAWFADADDNIKRKFDKLRKYPHGVLDNGEPETHDMIRSEAQSNFERDVKELSGVMSTARNHLTLYRDKTIAKNTGRSDWTIDDLMDDKSPATVYFVVRPGDQKRLRPLIRLILTQVVRKLTDELDFSGEQGQSPSNRRLLLALDEFPLLKRLPIIEEALPYLAGYGIKCLLVCQDLKQLRAEYTQNEALSSNCEIKVCFAPGELETAKWISESAGDTTIVAKRYSKSGKRNKITAENVSEGIAEHKRRLINVDEVGRLPQAQKDGKERIVAPGDVIIFIRGQYPIRTKQYLYFLDPELQRRKDIPAPKLSDSSDPRTLEARAQGRDDRTPSVLREREIDIRVEDGAQEHDDRTPPDLRKRQLDVRERVNVGGAAGAN